MLRFLLGRLAVLIPTFIGVSIIAFSFIRLLPGDPVAAAVGRARACRPSATPRSRTQLGFDRPIVIQYLDYLWGMLHGDFGTSIVTKRAGARPVPDSCSRRRWNCRSAPSSSPSCSAFRPASSPPSSAARCFDQAHHGHRAGRLFDADLLVGPAADHPVLRHPAVDAGVGPHLADVSSSRRSPASC